MDINKIIFSRTAPKKKVEIVENLTTKELLSITNGDSKTTRCMRGFLLQYLTIKYKDKL